jgi:hypothetical protein
LLVRLQTERVDRAPDLDEYLVWCTVGVNFRYLLSTWFFLSRHNLLSEGKLLLGRFIFNFPQILGLPRKVVPLDKLFARVFLVLACQIEQTVETKPVFFKLFDLQLSLRVAQQNDLINSRNNSIMWFVVDDELVDR